jgi:hypothetical membrane protein
MNKTCHDCKKKPFIQTKGNYSFIAGVLLAILPKCPFCVMAYTSTIMLCGEGTLIESSRPHYSSTTIFISVFFCLLIIAGILLNYRGKRTMYALGLCVIGILFILQSIIFSGGEKLYYIGISVLFTAIWLNTSLISLIRICKNAFSNFLKSPESCTS